MKNIVAVIVVALMASGCGYLEPKSDREITYTYDANTDLCFSWSKNAYGDSHSNVPCNEDVLRLAGVTMGPAAHSITGE